MVRSSARGPQRPIRLLPSRPPRACRPQEFIWRGADVGGHGGTHMFTHVLHTHYSAPHGSPARAAPTRPARFGFTTRHWAQDSTGRRAPCPSHRPTSRIVRATSRMCVRGGATGEGPTADARRLADDEGASQGVPHARAARQVPPRAGACCDTRRARTNARSAFWRRLQVRERQRSVRQYGPDHQGDQLQCGALASPVVPAHRPPLLSTDPSLYGCKVQYSTPGLYFNAVAVRAYGDRSHAAAYGPTTWMAPRRHTQRRAPRRCSRCTRATSSLTPTTRTPTGQATSPRGP
jgi:hypothetical protein